MVYTVYRTENLVNGKFYIGVHKTSDPFDSYLGSGKYLQAALKKYGAPNFRKRVLLITELADNAFAVEARLVEIGRQDLKCMNIRQGGAGGFDYINRSGIAATSKSKACRAAQKAWAVLLTDEKFVALWRANRRRSFELRGVSSKQHSNACAHILLAHAMWKGKHHTVATKLLMSSKKKGRLNNQYGTRWITDGTRNRKVSSQEELPTGWYFGRTGFTGSTEAGNRWFESSLPDQVLKGGAFMSAL